MKRSRRIGLVLMASLSLAACDSQQATEQALYQNQQDCVEDWGLDDWDYDDGHWHGPYYFLSGGRRHYYSKKGGVAMPLPATSKLASLAPGATPPHAISTKTASASRGGFGGSAGKFGALS